MIHAAVASALDGHPERHRSQGARLGLLEPDRHGDMGRNRRLGSWSRSVCCVVEQVAEKRHAGSRRPLGSLQDIAADKSRASARWSIWPASTRPDGLTARRKPPLTLLTSGPSSTRRRCRVVFCRRLSRRSRSIGAWPWAATWPGSQPVRLPSVRQQSRTASSFSRRSTTRDGWSRRGSG